VREPTHIQSSDPSADGEPLTISGGRVLTPGGVIRADLTVEGGLITAIGESDHTPTSRSIDATDLMVVPGFIDLQVNGGFGHDFTSDPETIWTVGARLPETGVTAFLPTIVTSPRSTIATARNVLASGPPKGYLGALPLGLHLEGPMLSPMQLGTHDPVDLEVPEPELIEDWSPEGQVRMVTLAPEVPGAYDIIETLSERGVVVSVGHSDASYAQAVEGFRRGASFGTHLFNAMAPFHHREPGLIGALLDEADIAVGIIVDGIHLHPAAVRLAWRAKRPDRLVLVTDAMAAMGLGQGSFDLGTIEVTVDETGPRNPAGDLAGSTLSLDQAIRNFVSVVNCSEVEGVEAASTNPAGVVDDPGRGTLQVRARADATLVDSDLRVKATLVAGEVVFSSPDVALEQSSGQGAGS